MTAKNRYSINIILRTTDNVAIESCLVTADDQTANIGPINTKLKKFAKLMISF